MDAEPRVFFKDSDTAAKYKAVMQHLKQVQLKQAAAQQQIREAKKPTSDGAKPRN